MAQHCPLMGFALTTTKPHWASLTYYQLRYSYTYGTDKQEQFNHKIKIVFFSMHQSKHVFWVLKTTLSLRRLFWIPTIQKNMFWLRNYK